MRYLSIVVLIVLFCVASSCTQLNESYVSTSNSNYNLVSMPEPFERADNSGGDELHDYYSKYVFRFGNINSTLISLADEEEAQKWINSQLSEQDYEFTVLDYINYFKIPKEELIKAISDSKFPEGWIINISDIDIIYSGNVELINKTFVNEYALLYDNKIYTPEWLYNNSIADYIKEGLPANEVKACLNRMKVFPFTDAAIAALDKKIMTIPEMYNSDFVFDDTYDETLSTSTIINDSYDDITINTNELPEVTTTTGADYEGNYISTTAD